MLHSALVIAMLVCAVLMTVLMLVNSEKDGLKAFDGTKAQYIEGVSSPLRMVTVWTAGAFLFFAVVLNLVSRS
jgi:protein translocase SecG subunit